MRREGDGRRLNCAQAHDFDAGIAPILARCCLDCHSGADPKGKLDLSKSAMAMRGGKHGPAIVAGKPDESLVWERIESDEMPPKEPLAEAEKGFATGLDCVGGCLGDRSNRSISGDNHPPRRPRLVVVAADPSANSANGPALRLGSRSDRRFRHSKTGNR